MIYFHFNRPVETLIPAIKGVLMSPKAFFAEMPGTVLFGNSIFLFSLVIIAGSLLSFPFDGASTLFLLPVTWGVILLANWAWAAYLGWAVRTFGKQRLNTPSAFQICTYASIPMLLGFIPYTALLVDLWVLYLTFTGLVAFTGINVRTAVMIMLVPLAILMVSMSALLVLLVDLVPQLHQYIPL